MASIDVEGLGQVLDRLSKLRSNVQQNVVRAGLRAGAKVIADDAIQRAQEFDDPTTTESIAKNIAVRANARLGRKNGGAAVQVGIRGGAKKIAGEVKGKGSANPGGDTYYWRFREFGTVNEPARPFMQPAMNTQASAAFSKAADTMEKRLQRELNKL